MGFRDWLVGREPTFRSELLKPREEKIRYVEGYEVGVTTATLIHGPGATELTGGRGNYNDSNSAVFACLTALAEGYTEAPLRVFREKQPGQRTVQSDHPLQLLLDNPNPYLSALELWWWVQWAKHLDGNAYLRKVFNRAGQPMELWPISPCRVEILGDANTFVAGYKYMPRPGYYEIIPPEEIVHFRLGIDDKDHRSGLSPLKRLVRAITTDDRAAEWTDTLLKNGALPGMLMSVNQPLTGAQAEEISDRAQAKYGEGNKGRIGVFGYGASMQQLGFNPEQMLLKELHSIPESRIAAVLRVPPIVAGLGVGLDVSTYSNYGQAREAFAQSTLSALWKQDEAKIQTQLRPDFTTDRKIIVAHDLTEVRAFQEDENTKSERLARATGGPYMTVNEARTKSGLPTIPGGDVIYVPSSVTPTETNDLAPAPPQQPSITVQPADEPLALPPGDNAPTPLPVGNRRAASRKSEEPITQADIEDAILYWEHDPDVANFLLAEPRRG